MFGTADSNNVYHRWFKDVKIKLCGLLVTRTHPITTDFSYPDVTACLLSHENI
jgi:hypothetical protein